MTAAALRNNIVTRMCDTKLPHQGYEAWLMTEYFDVTMVKIFIGNLSQDTRAEELRSLFSQYGKVSECDVLKRYGFVHMDSHADAEEAIRNLNQRELHGNLMSVQLSTSRLRTEPGMGDHTGCFVCGQPGHWSKECHLALNGGARGGDYGNYSGRDFHPGSPAFGKVGVGYVGYSGSPGIPRGPAPASYRGSSFGSWGGYAAEMSSLPLSYRPPRPYSRAGNAFPNAAAAYESKRHSGAELYEKFRARLSSAGISYGDEQRFSPTYSSVPASPAISRELPAPSPLHSYKRRPPLASNSSYYSRDRSPVRRGSASGDGVSYERLRLTPVSTFSRSSAYDLPSVRDTCSDQARYAY